MSLPELASIPELAGVLTVDEVLATVAAIGAVQERTGAIPWFTGGEVDPWDHVECAMALDVGGRHDQARRAYRWLRREQRPDGSWPSRYRGGRVSDPTGETHHAAYVAVGVWHHWLATGDEATLSQMWPTVRRAVAFTLAQQAGSGAVWWAVGPAGQPDPVALITGSSSIYQSLRCAVAIAGALGTAQPGWELALGRLGKALRDHPAEFADKRRFSMDWYYPVLTGALRGEAGRRRIDARWGEFVLPGLGALCVDDRPWVTGAETCELALALHTLGRNADATELVRSMQHLREDDGSYWTGLVVADGLRWPVERSTWTAAAVVLAVDALHGGHPRTDIFPGARLPHGTDLRDLAAITPLGASGAADAASPDRAVR